MQLAAPGTRTHASASDALRASVAGTAHFVSLPLERLAGPTPSVPDLLGPRSSLCVGPTVRPLASCRASARPAGALTVDHSVIARSLSRLRYLSVPLATLLVVPLARQLSPRDCVASLRSCASHASSLALLDGHSSLRIAALPSLAPLSSGERYAQTPLGCECYCQLASLPAAASRLRRLSANRSHRLAPACRCGSGLATARFAAHVPV